MRLSAEKKTRRDRLKSAPYLRLKKIQGTTIGNICKKLFLKFFFEKSVLLSRTMPKNSKRGHSGSLNVFTNRKLQKNARGYPLIESENFRKKSHSAETKTNKKTKRKKTFGLASIFGSIKKIVVLCENRTHGLLFLRKLVEQINKDCKKSGPFRVRLSTEKEKKLPNVIAGLFFLKGKGAD